MSELLGTLGALVASLGNVQTSAVLRERLALAAQQAEALVREAADLRAQLAQVQQQAALAQQQQAALQQQVEELQAGTDAQARRKGWVCDHCGSARLRRMGTRLDPVFGELGAKLVKLSCLACNASSEFGLEPGE